MGFRTELDEMNDAIVAMRMGDKNKITKTDIYAPSKNTTFKIGKPGEEDIHVKYWPGMPLLEQWEGGNWVDLYCREDVTLQPGESTIIHLGVAMKLPEGYEAYITPRSSTFKRWGLIQTNSIGIIDSTYCGNNDEWGMPIYATRAVTIPRGTRLCQFRIQKPQPKLNFIISTDLGESRGGWGTTGA